MTKELTIPIPHNEDDLTIRQLERIIANHESGVQLTGVHTYRQLLATMQQQAEYRSIFRRCVEIIGLHNGGDDEKIEAIRRTMLQAPHINENERGNTHE